MQVTTLFVHVANCGQLTQVVPDGMLPLWHTNELLPPGQVMKYWPFGGHARHVPPER